MQYIVNSFPRSGSTFFENLLADTFHPATLERRNTRVKNLNPQKKYIVHSHEIDNLSYSSSDTKIFSIVRNPTDSIASLMLLDGTSIDSACKLYFIFYKKLIENRDNCNIISFKKLISDPVSCLKENDIIVEASAPRRVLEVMDSTTTNHFRNHSPMKSKRDYLNKIKRKIYLETEKLNYIYFQALELSK